MPHLCFARRRAPFALALMLCLSVLSPSALGQNAGDRSEAEKLWRSFVHNVLIARPDRAGQAADALLADSVSASDLLDAVEAVGEERFTQVARRTLRMPGVTDSAAALYAKVQSARIERASDPERIRADIVKLGATERERINATTRLAAAGQFAAPELLAVLVRDDPEAKRLRPYVVRAMSEIGAPLAYPLAVALPKVDADRQVILCAVLEDAGYPAALPYVKQTLEAQQAENGATTAAARSAYASLRRIVGAPATLSAAELFVLLGEDYYGGRYLVGQEEFRGVGVLWSATDQGALAANETPLAAYPDHRAMQATRAALELDPALDSALNLYLASNLRRENRLGEQTDPAYTGKPAAYYATLAGPLRLQAVLGRALDTRNAPLARDAIESLAQTAGPDLLLALSSPRQPVLQALTFPDERVRRRAAMALANIRPQAEFTNMQLVVPTLAETVRESDQKYAVVLANRRDRAERFAAVLADAGYVTIPGQSLSEATPAIATSPAADLVVIEDAGESLRQNMALVSANVKLGGAAILVLTLPADQILLRNQYPEPSQVTVAGRPEEDSQLLAATQRAMETYTGADISSEDAQAMALESLALLRRLAADPGLYPVEEAEPVLIAALEDTRPEVVQSVGRTLALFDTPEAQQALARAAAVAEADTEIALLDSLAESARRIGRRTAGEQAEAIRQKVDSTDREVALAAARAYGALSLPTDRSVQAVLED
ncbi:MAG: hypothetical protein AAF288_14215 [Planctomycetota bacterium]